MANKGKKGQGESRTLLPATEATAVGGPIPFPFTKPGDETWIPKIYEKTDQAQRLEKELKNAITLLYREY